MIKDIEFILKKIFLSEKYLLRKRLKRAIHNNYEKELKIIEKFADKTNDALDIGVYRGVYSYKLSQYFKMVHAFEPNPLLYPYLEKNLTKIIKNIKLYNIALSDENGETVLKLPLRTQSFFRDNIEELFQLGAATIHPHNKIEEFKSINVNKKKLDDIIKKNVSFIKIDVEGHEKSVITGAKNLISKFKPTLLVEIEKRHSGTNVKDTINYINNFGYNSYFLKDNDLISTDKSINFKTYNNYIFVKKN